MNYSIVRMLRSAAVSALCALLLVSCSTDPQNESSDIETVPTVPEQTESMTEEQTTAEPVTELPEAVEAVVGYGKINPLTGLPAEEEYVIKRPAAIMINNVRIKVGGQLVTTAQRGISNADIMYEAVVEGGVTRLMMVVNDYEKLPEVGSVRSSREYYLDFAANHDALYIHAGGSPEAYNQINNVRKTDNIDFVNPVNGIRMDAYQYRSNELLNKGYGYEHTLMTNGELIVKAIGRLKYRTEIKANFDSPLDFVPAGEERIPDGQSATYLQVKYSGGTAPYYNYNAADGLYYRYQYGAAHVDQANGKQLAFENIILLYCPSYNTYDDKNRQDVTTTGTGTGYYFSNGKCEEITWKKATVNTPVKLYGKDGSELLVNRGKTFFQIVEKSMESETVIK